MTTNSEFLRALPDSWWHWGSHGDAVLGYEASLAWCAMVSEDTDPETAVQATSLVTQINEPLAE